MSYSIKETIETVGTVNGIDIDNYNLTQLNSIKAIITEKIAKLKSQPANKKIGYFLNLNYKVIGGKFDGTYQISREFYKNLKKAKSMDGYSELQVDLPTSCPKPRYDIEKCGYNQDPYMIWEILKWFKAKEDEVLLYHEYGEENCDNYLEEIEETIDKFLNKKPAENVAQNKIISPSDYKLFYTTTTTRMKNILYIQNVKTNTFDYQIHKDDIENDFYVVIDNKLKNVNILPYIKTLIEIISVNKSNYQYRNDAYRKEPDEIVINDLKNLIEYFLNELPNYLEKADKYEYIDKSGKNKDFNDAKSLFFSKYYSISVGNYGNVYLKHTITKDYFCIEKSSYRVEFLWHKENGSSIKCPIYEYKSFVLNVLENSKCDNKFDETQKNKINEIIKILSK